MPPEGSLDARQEVVRLAWMCCCGLLVHSRPGVLSLPGHQMLRAEQHRGSLSPADRRLGHAREGRLGQLPCTRALALLFLAAWFPGAGEEEVLGCLQRVVGCCGGHHTPSCRLAGHGHLCLYREWTLVLVAVSPKLGLGLGATQGKLRAHSGKPGSPEVPCHGHHWEEATWASRPCHSAHLAASGRPASAMGGTLSRPALVALAVREVATEDEPGAVVREAL